MYEEFWNMGQFEGSCVTLGFRQWRKKSQEDPAKTRLLCIGPTTRDSSENIGGASASLRACVRACVHACMQTLEEGSKGYGFRPLRAQPPRGRANSLLAEGCGHK